MTATTTHDISLSLAGLYLSNGDLDRAAPIASWTAPRSLAIERKHLIRKSDDITPRIAGPQMLDAFVQLKTDAQILSFATKWGLLGLCRGHPTAPVRHDHWRGPGHGRVQRGKLVRGRMEGKRFVAGCGELAESEGLETWRAYVRQYRAILNLAACAHLGREGAAPDMRDAFPEFAAGIDAHWPNASPGLRLRFESGLASNLAAKVSTLLHLVDLRVGFSWQLPEPPRIQIRSFPPTLLGALTLKLALAIARQPDIYQCSSCGALIDLDKRGRLPARGRRSYCTACREKGIPQRDATRDSRERKKRRNL